MNNEQLSGEHLNGDQCKNIAVLVSGGGTNLQAIIDAIASGRLKKTCISLVVSSRHDAYALERAKQNGIPTCVIASSDCADANDMSIKILDMLRAAKADIIVLAGYMSILSADIVRAYPKRIINIHPSLIPKHCGKGYYGIRVHESVLESGDSESGATVHFVDEGVDTGEIIMQERVPVIQGDTAKVLAARVLEAEHRILVEAINKVLEKI